jgi:hypothetical protein
MDKSKIPTSLQSFPTPFLRALMHDSYVPGSARFSVTGLLSPPKRTWLKTLGEEIRSPYGMFSALMGTAIHHVIETHVDVEAGEIAEQRFYSEVNIDGELITVSGQVDLIENRVVTDFKNTSGTQDKAKNDHVKQAQMNGLLAERNGITVEHVSIVYIDRTWSHMRSTVDPTYPRTPFKIFIFPYDRQLAIDTFARTVRDHVEAALGSPRECTSEEMWEKPTTYAITKPGAKRASKLCDSYAEARELLKAGQIIEDRPGERTFCGSFCGLSHLCNSHQTYLRKIANQSKEEP